MTVRQLKPRSTTVYENEQKVRLKPNANADIGSTGQTAAMKMGPNSTALEETVTRVRLRGVAPNDLPAVSGGGAGHPDITGEDLGNKTFTLVNQPNVPVIYGLLFVDQNDNVTVGDVTINYDDDTDTGRSDNFDIIIDGKGPHYTSFKVKTLTSITGQNFDAAGGGAPTTSDELVCGPYVSDAAWDILASNGGHTVGGYGDPNDNSNDGDAFYISSNEITDQRCYVRFPDVDTDTGAEFPDGSALDVRAVTIESIRFRFGLKNVGSGSAGIQTLFRIGDADSDWVLSTFTTNGTEAGTHTLVDPAGAMLLNPKTGVGWTVAELNDIQAGVKFLGDNPAIEKRWNTVRIEVTFRQGFVHPTLDGIDPANQTEHWQVVAKDPFVTPTDDDTQHIRTDPSTQSLLTRFAMEDLPAEAVGVNTVEAFVRWTYINTSGINTTTDNDHACGVATGDQYGIGAINKLDGPVEQTNLGGITIAMDISGGILGSRLLLGVGDPSGGCGPFTNFPGFDGDFGTYREDSLLTAVNGSAAAISVANVNGMEVGAQLNNRQGTHYRMSRVFAEVEYLRRPTNGQFLHLVIDDDPESPDDSDYMPSQHSADKTFAVDFSGIPEVTQINSVKATIRAKQTVTGTAGWRMAWRTNGMDTFEATQQNTSFQNVEFTLSLNPVTSLPWTREEVQNLQIVWQARGENDFEEKQLSMISLEVDFDEIPEKIDNARDIASRKLRLRRKPMPFLKVKLPLQFLDIGILGDLQVVHRAIPRTTETIGFELWDRSLFRVFKEVLDLNKQEVELTMLDLRDFLVSLWITGRTTTKGQSAEGMAVMTPGVRLGFDRPTNDYFEAPVGVLLQELNSDVPPTGQDGILVQNKITQRLLNNFFSEGATDVFTEWTIEDSATGASIVEDPLDIAFEQFIGAPARSVLMTGADTPADVYVEQVLDLADGDGETPAGAWYALSIDHKDDSGEPLSVAIVSNPVGFTSRNYRFGDTQWIQGGGLLWKTLPVVSARTRHTLVLGNMDAMTQTPSQDDMEIELKIGVRTAANQINHVYGATIEGGTLVAGEDVLYATTRVLTKTGPVVRDQLGFNVPVRSTLPAYPANLRGTFFCELVPQWNGADLPFRAGVKRYVYGLVINGSNHDICWYDQDTESFVFERQIAGVTKSVSIFYPAVSKGRPIRVATRWISSLGELDEPPFSIRMFVDNIESGVESFTQGHSLPSETLLYLGSKDGSDGEMFDGFIRDITVKQFALPFDSIKRLP